MKTDRLGRITVSKDRARIRLGAPADIDALNHKIISLEQQVTDLRMQLDERDQDLAAARAANRELMARLNTTRR